MGTKIGAIAGDCSHLPFSRGEAGRLRERNDEVEKKVAFDPKHPELLRLRRLAGNPILTWPPTLPPRDPRGVESAMTFECWKKASASRVGIAGSYFSLKAGGRVACHSHLEARLLRYFEMCPFVVEIRTQYPSWEREKYLQYVMRGSRMRKTELMTIDFMLTLQIPGYPYRLYHGVSGKPAALVGQPKVKERHEREIEQLWRWGSTHEVMTDATMTDMEFNNYRRLFSYMYRTNDIRAHALAAADFARALKATTARGSLDRVIQMISKRIGFSAMFGYRLFGIAHFLGYLRWDHRHVVAPELPMMILREM
jgi:hypothetical protein